MPPYGSRQGNGLGLKYNADFMQEVDDIAEMSRNEEFQENGQKTTEHKAGLLMHFTATNMQKNYQSDINDRNLDAEICYKGHTAHNANIGGYTRIDVHDKG